VKISIASQEGIVQFSAPSAPVPREATVATLTHLQSFSALFVCLTVGFLSAFVFNVTHSGSFQLRNANAMLSAVPNTTSPGPMSPVSNGTITGKVTYEGTPKKYKPIDMSAEPNCAKFYSSSPMPEVSVTGPQNSLQNVIVFISQGAPDENPSSQSQVIHLNQRGCRYTPHVTSVQTGQEVWVQNDDVVTHSVHPMAHMNAEWNRSQPPGTPPVVIRYDQPEFIKVKCELHSWMRGVLAVFKNSHHSVTDNTGAFSLPDLPPGNYTVTAWHELYGTQSKQITITAGDKKDLDFVFHVTPY
jgi:plastocyanin